jgi:hypothetical protein
VTDAFLNVTIEFEVVVVADDEASAEEVARDELRDIVINEEPGIRAVPVPRYHGRVVLPVGYDETSFPYGGGGIDEKHLGFTVGVAELLCDPSAGKPRVVRIPR